MCIRDRASSVQRDVRVSAAPARKAVSARVSSSPDTLYASLSVPALTCALGRDEAVQSHVATACESSADEARSLPEGANVGEMDDSVNRSIAQV